MNWRRIILAIVWLCSCVPAARADGPSGREHVRIAFGSCIDDPRSQVWDRILDRSPDLFVLLGDIIYLRDGEWLSPDSMARRYERLLSDPGFARLRRSVPVVGIWDDHDYGPNNSDGMFPFAYLTVAAFRRAFHWLPNPPEGLPGYASFVMTLGPVKLIATDSRSGRRYPSHGAPGRLFGDAQLSWIVREIMSSSAPVTVLASGGQILARGGGNERLAAYADEEAILFRALGESPSYPVIISGDRHFGEIVELPFGERSVMDITSSPLTAPPRKLSSIAPLGKRAPPPFVSGGSLLGVHNFGIIDIETTSGGIDVLSKVVSSAPGGGEIRRHIRISR